MTHLNPELRPTSDEILTNNSIFNKSLIEAGDCILRRFKIKEVVEFNSVWKISDLKNSNKM